MTVTRTVAILGTGPSAAYAYRACRDMGLEPAVYGKLSDRPHGAFWLHWLPPQLQWRVPYFQVEYRAEGTADGYVLKIWGRPDISSSFPRERRIEKGWLPDPGLAALWEGAGVTEVLLNEEDIQRLCGVYDLVIRTFPPRLPELLREQLHFCTLFYRRVTAGRYANIQRVERLTYNGLPGVPWVRSARLAGELSYEFPGVVEQSQVAEHLGPGNWQRAVWPDLPPQEHTEFWLQLHRWEKEIWQPSQPSNLLTVGRYATWQRKGLSHQAYQTVLGALYNRFGLVNAPSMEPSPLVMASH